MSFLFKLAKDFLSLLLVLFVFSLSTYVTDDELQNVKITPGDQIIIDLIKKWFMYGPLGPFLIYKFWKIKNKVTIKTI